MKRSFTPGKFAFLAPLFCLALPSNAAIAPSYESLMKDGVAAYSARKWTDADDKFKAALSLKEKSGKEDKELQVVLAYLAATSHEEGKLTEGEAFGKRCTQLSEKVFGPNDPETAKQYRLLATIEMSQERPADAEALLLKATGILEKAGPAYAFNYLRAVFTLEQCYLTEKKYDPAIQLALKRQAWVAKHSPKDLLANLSEGADLAGTYTYAGQNAKAHEVYKALYKFAQGKTASQNIDALIRMKIATNALVVGDFDYAESTLLVLVNRHPMLVPPKTATNIDSGSANKPGVKSGKPKVKPKTSTNKLSVETPLAEKQLRARAYLLLTQISAAKGDLAKMKVYMLKAKEAGETFSDRDFAQPVLSQAILFAKLGNRDLAQKNFQLAMLIDERMFGKTSTKLLGVIDPYTNYLQDIKDSKNLQSLTVVRQKIEQKPGKKDSHLH